MFEAFDLNVLDSPDFKEDAVREEIIAPLLKRLGYQPSGKARVQRSKTLAHPFVRIGTRKHNVNIVPDYTLYYDDKPILVLDAKNPSEMVLNSHHVEQAYSYAIHPEVRCRHFALCNGRQLVVFDIEEFDPVLLVGIQEFDSRWADIEKHLLPGSLLDPLLRKFQPDLGLAVKKLGMKGDTDFMFLSCRLQLIGRVSDELYTASTALDLEGIPHLASFDFPAASLEPILSCLPQPLVAQTKDALSRAPFQAQVDFMLELDWATRLGPLTRGQDDSFVPFLVTHVLASRFNRMPPESEANDIPSHVFRLRRAFESLQKTSELPSP